MKIFLLVILMTAQTTFAVDFEIGNKQEPLVVKVTTCEQYRCYDSSAEVRKNAISLANELGSMSMGTDFSVGYVTTHWSSPTINYGSTKAQPALSLHAALLSAIGSCPVFLTFDRTTFKITKVKTTCDIY